MIDEFWRQYNQSLFAHYYHQYERDFWARLLRWISIGSYIITAFSVAGWGFTKQYELAWSIVIFSSQLINGLKDQYSISKKIWALELYLGASSTILVEVTKTWRNIKLGKLYEDDILKKINQCHTQFNDLEEKYIRPYSYNDSKRLTRKADKRTNEELRVRHGEDD